MCMMKVSLILTLCFLYFNGVYGYKLICVYTNWSQYRPDGGKFFPEDVDTSMCTHLIYVYAKIQGNKLAPVEWNDDGNAWREGMYQRFNALKQYNPDLKTMLGVGGWNQGSKDFSRIASTPMSRRRFARSAVSFLRERDFDGLTIDWQHPTQRKGHRRDRVNFSLLLQELRRAFEEDSKQSNQPTLLLSIGVAASRYIIDSAYEVHNISKYVDFMNVFAYDLHGPWDNYTGHPSPLYAREDELGPASEINVDTSMKYWISLGIDRSKLVLGISTYGRTFTLKEPRYNGYGVPTTGPGAAEKYTREPGMIAYYERCNQYFDAPRIWDKQSKVAYWHSGDQWIAGEDVESVKHKVYWARLNGIDSFMLWSMDTDDINGTCSQETMGLHRALKDELDNPTQPPTTVQPVTVTEPTELPTETRVMKPTTPASVVKKTSQKVMLTRTRSKISRTKSTKRPSQNRRTKAPNRISKTTRQMKAANQKAKTKNPKSSQNPPTTITTPKPKVETAVQENMKSKIEKQALMDKVTNDILNSEKQNPKSSKSNPNELKQEILVKNTKQTKVMKTSKNNNNSVNAKSQGKIKQPSVPNKRNPKKGRRRKLTRAQRLRIIQHRRRLMVRRKKMRKRKTTTPQPKVTPTPKVQQ